MIFYGYLLFSDAMLYKYLFHDHDQLVETRG